MKLVICIANNRDKPSLHSALTDSGFQCTILPSIGGFLQKNNSVFLIGITPEKLSELTALIQRECKAREELVSSAPVQGGSLDMIIQTPMKVTVGGAVLFVLDAEQFIKV